MNRYYVAIGSNLGDRLASVRAAIDELAATPEIDVARRSDIWETRPVGPGTGPFLNAAVELLSPRAAPDLLDQLLAIERRHGRLRREKWGDRTLDLDLLCGYADDGHELILDVPGLTLPHPELRNRDFALQPLTDIDPHLEIHGQTCAALLAALVPEQRTLLRRLDQGMANGEGSGKVPRPGG